VSGLESGVRAPSPVEIDARNFSANFINAAGVASPATCLMTEAIGRHRILILG
jgi:hypothetical protein